MKKYNLLICLCAIALTSAAQLVERETADWKTIGKLMFGGITKAKMEYISSGADTTYLLFVKDVREQPKNNYFSIQFKGSGDSYHKLYVLLKSFFLPENKKNKKYSKTFTLGNTGVNVQHHRLITNRGIMFFTKEGYTYWSENDIDKLFGKE
jgi:hypothetical protein